jgi:hypothetical protein
MDRTAKQLHSSGKEVIDLLHSTIIRMYGSLNNYAHESRIEAGQLKDLLSGSDKSLQLFFQVVFDANASLSLMNCSGKQVVYPEPRESDCSAPMEADDSKIRETRKRA